MTYNQAKRMTALKALKIITSLNQQPIIPYRVEMKTLLPDIIFYMHFYDNRYGVLRIPMQIHIRQEAQALIDHMIKQKIETKLLPETLTTIQLNNISLESLKKNAP